MTCRFAGGIKTRAILDLGEEYAGEIGCDDSHARDTFTAMFAFE